VLAAFAVGGSSHFSVLSAAISSTSTVELVSKRFLAVSLHVCIVECIQCRGEILLCVYIYLFVYMYMYTNAYMYAYACIYAYIYTNVCMCM
jgi:hypothetical protein